VDEPPSRVERGDFISGPMEGNATDNKPSTIEALAGRRVTAQPFDHCDEGWIAEREFAAQSFSFFASLRRALPASL
jgi:hypothetical protein